MGFFYPGNFWEPLPLQGYQGGSIIELDDQIDSLRGIAYNLEDQKYIELWGQFQSMEFVEIWLSLWIAANRQYAFLVRLQT